MITLRRAKARGHANHGWLDSYHTFSFAGYYDPKHMNFRSLRVINEDWISASMGFGTHGHKDMEIITYVLEGALEHKDSMGNGSIIRPGEVQHMTAGTGIQHSEFNHSATDTAHLLQIWIVPDTQNLTPSYDQRAFHVAKSPGQLNLVVSKDGRDNTIHVHQDMDLYAGVLPSGTEVDYAMESDRHTWIQVARGSITLNGTELYTGDAAAISAETELKITATSDAEILLFDLA
jgi:quercetin 2,3-dioxygenase